MPSTTAVRDVMTTDVVTLRPDQTFEEAADVLAGKRIGAAPVVDADGKVIGLVRDEDLIVSEGNLHAPTTLNILGTGFTLPGSQKHFEEELKRMVAADVRGLMTTEYATTGPDNTLADVAERDARRRRDAHARHRCRRQARRDRRPGRHRPTPGRDHLAGMPEQFRPVWGEVDLGAVRANVRTLVELARPAALLAVVKADGYGHGAVPIAEAALDAGASWLGVALVEEGRELREAGIDARILVLSEPIPAAAPAVVANDLTPVVYTANGIEALAKAVADAGAAPLAVHVKVDTGMHRVGCAPDEVGALVQAVAGRPELVLEGICTHLAVADEADNPYTGQQLAEFDRVDRRARRTPPAACTRRTRPGCWRIRRPRTTSCASASPSTASRPRRRCGNGRRSSRCSPSRPASRTSNR